MGQIYGKRNEFSAVRVAKATYDFATHAGTMADAVGLGVIIPTGAVILEVIGRVVTAFTSDGAATVAINIGATEVNAATAFDHADYTGVDSHYSTAAAISGEINIDIAGAALTAGVYDIYVRYVY